MKKIKVQVKKIGKRQPSIEPKVLELNTSKEVLSLKELLCLVVECEVERFNNKARLTDEDGSFTRPNESYLDILTHTGKAGFEGVYNPTLANVVEAQENALQCFEDGMYAVFKEEEPLESLSQEVSIENEPCFTFIRLTFLAGGMF